MNWCHILERYNDECPQKEAVIFEDRRFTWEELNRRVNAVAQALVNLGLEKGDRLAIITYNCSEFIELTFATNKVGGVWVPLNWRLAGEELLYIINDSGTKIIVADPEFCEVIDSIRERLTTAKVFICLGTEPTPNWQSYDRLVEQNLGAKVPSVEMGMDDLHRLNYTSGTTAHPKGVMITYGNLYWKCVSHAIVFNLGFDDRALVAMPLFHAAAYDLPASTTLYLGGTIIILRKYSGLGVLEAIQQEKATHIVFTATITRMLLSEPTFDNYDLTPLKVIIVGGEQVTIDLIHTGLKKLPGCWFAHSYGMTETVTGDTFIRQDKILEKIESVGIPMPQLQIKIVDDNDIDVPRGTWGEVVLRGPKLCKGYWNKPDITAVAFKNGWFHTGDIGYMDKEGYLYIVDRKKDMIKSGGENIATAEVEAVILQIPQVAEVAIIGIPHPKWGETPKAFIVLGEGQTLAAEQVKEHCLKKLAKFKVPSEVEFIDSMPRTPLGKILKRELRERPKK